MEPHSGLNTLDYVVIGTILLSGLLALMRGFMREMFSLIAWGGAYFAAVKFYPLAVPTAHHYIKNDKAAEWTAMAAVFLVALVLLMILGSLVCGLIKHRALTTIDHSLGLLYGLIRGALVVGLVYLGAVMIFWPDIDAPPEIQQQDKERNVPPELLLDAKTRPAMSYIADKLKPFVPKEMIDEKIKDAEDKFNAHQSAEKQEMLDRLSTPAPTGEGGGTPIGGSTTITIQGGKP